MKNWAVDSSLRRSCGVIRAYAGTGVRCSGPSPSVPRRGGGRRGRVSGFSSASSRRFRDLLLSLEGPPGYRAFSYTLTLRDVHSPAWWRSRVNCFAQRLRRYRVCGFWRVELQRRGVPHLHCVLFLPGNMDFGCLSQSWLEVCGVQHDPDHIAHAVDCRPIDTEGWYNYVATHATKHKGEQLGWQGRQWGVWTRALLRQRSSRLEVAPHDAHHYAMRLYSRYLRLRGRRPVGGYNEFARFVDEHEQAVVFACLRRGIVHHCAVSVRGIAAPLLFLLGFQPSEDCAVELFRVLVRVRVLLARVICGYNFGGSVC